jgi:hypothetical protein
MRHTDTLLCCIRLQVDRTQICSPSKCQDILRAGRTHLVGASLQATHRAQLMQSGHSSCSPYLLHASLNKQTHVASSPSPSPASSSACSCLPARLPAAQLSSRCGCGLTAATVQSQLASPPAACAPRPGRQPSPAPAAAPCQTPPQAWPRSPGGWMRSIKRSADTYIY